MKIPLKSVRIGYKKREDGGGGLKIPQKKCDLIFEQPLTVKYQQKLVLNSKLWNIVSDNDFEVDVTQKYLVFSQWPYMHG